MELAYQYWAEPSLYLYIPVHFWFIRSKSYDLAFSLSSGRSAHKKHTQPDAESALL